MANWKEKLTSELRKIEGVEDRPSPMAGGTALFFRGKEFAHFHTDTELDLRLTKQRIRELGLTHPTDSFQHPRRSASSHWIELRFESAREVAQVKRLVELLVEDMA